MFRDLDIFQLASQQLGLVARTDLDSLGASERVRSRLVRRGLLEQVSQQVFRVAGSPPSTNQQIRAACMDLNGAATRATAAWLHGIAGFRAPKRKPEVVCLEELCQYRSALSSTHSSTIYCTADVTIIDGVPVMNIGWTLFSLAAEIPGPKARFATPHKRRKLRERLRNAVDDAIRSKKCTDEELRAFLQRIRCRGRNGVTEFQAVLDDRAQSPTESWLERKFLSILDKHGEPRPICQARIEADGVFVARVDFRYPGSSTAIEVSGYKYHSSREQQTRDANRRSELALQGVSVMEFTYNDLMDRPRQVAQMVRRLLAEQSTT